MIFYITDGIFHRAGLPPEPTSQSIPFEIADDADAVIIPDGVTSIWRCAFSECRSIEKISIPDSVSYIGLMGFSACAALREISLPRHISAIGGRAFQGCRTLQSITLPSSLSTVAEYTFCGCASLRSVDLPDGIYSVSSWAFAYCSSLETISIPASVENIGRSVFYNCPSLRSISLAAHHLREPELQETLQSIRVIHCIAPIDEIPDEWKIKCCIGFAENEAAYSEKMQKDYIAHIRLRAAELCKSALDHPVLLRLLCREKLIDDAHFDALLDEALRREAVELTALLLEYRRTCPTSSENDFLKDSSWD